MFYIVHILAGAVIAKFFPNVFLIIILGLVSHFLIDAIPHKDSIVDKDSFKRNYKVKITKNLILFESIEILINILVIIYLLIYFKSLLMLFAIFVSLLPDIIKIGYLTRLKNNNLFKKYMLFHSRIQKDVSWKLGILIQIIFLFILIKVLF
jgi:hypothetical protein